MRKMNRFIPVALACAIFAAQPVQAATIIRDSDKQATSQNKQTTNSGKSGCRCHHKAGDHIGGRNPLRCDERKSSLREECR